MGGNGGGRALAEKLEALREAMHDYFGTLNEIKMGLTAKVPEKPMAYDLYIKTERLGIPLVSGGLIDQPHIWLMELGVILETEQVYSSMEAMASETSE